MKKIIVFAGLLVVCVLISCSQKNTVGTSNIDFENVKKDLKQWWTYHKKNIILSSNFVALDNSSNRISKEAFLKQLTSGDFIALKQNSSDSIYYKLFRLEGTYDHSISQAIKNDAAEAYKNFKMENKEFPHFSFKDLNGVEYSSENTKGKILVIKCWFISCVSCVAEFPQLNEFVNKYKDRRDIEFISLAFDEKDDLSRFLLKKPFSYAVISDQKDFMHHTLGITMYPTHIIIDRKGIIRKVVHNATEMIDALEKDVLLSEEAEKK